MKVQVQVLVMAKAPVAGEAKTRLGAVVGMEAAADLAAAALLDTLAVCRQVFGGACHLALDGDLDLARRGDEIGAALVGWSVFRQQGVDLAERLVHAHRAVATDVEGPVLQIGMDTPHLTPALLRSVAESLENGAEVIVGPAEDGGWWALGVRDGRDAHVLAEVAMSQPDTCAATVEAFLRAGSAVVSAPRLTDVDTVEDAVLVGGLAPDTHFGRAWAARGVAVP